MKVLLLPLDERPCNRVFPQMIAESNDEIELVVPPLELLGDKKRSADVAGISAFLTERAAGCDAAVLSLDMLLYGGLIPSRLHHLERSELDGRLDVVRALKRANPAMRVYAFQCIMRCPSYDSAEEEPDYYEDFGFALFRRKYLLDVRERTGELSADEERELAAIEVPEEVLGDYEHRRDLNCDMNIAVLDLIGEGAIDFLVIPQDDSAPFGYTAIAQKRVIAALKERRLDDRVMIYPGADEVAMSLLTRAWVEHEGLCPSIWPFYASVLGPTIVPNYEDRPMFESLKSHVRVVGAHFADVPSEADVILAINAPGKVMQESFVAPEEVDLTYTSYRNLADFTQRIAEHLARGRRVALCDSAFSNGGDRACIEQLDRLGVLGSLASYAGWNTNCNTLGTTLAQAIVGRPGQAATRNLYYRIIEDVFYQAEVRPAVVDRDLPAMGLSYYDFGDRQADVEELIRGELQQRFDALDLAREHPVRIESVYMPWRRMFEIGMEIELEA